MAQIVDTKILERYQFGVGQRFSRTRLTAIANVDLSTAIDYDLDALQVKLVANVLTERLTVVETRHPADWWEAIKDRWFPAWALRRWPVRWAVFRLDPLVHYPTIPLPDHRGILNYQMVTAPRILDHLETL